MASKSKDALPHLERCAHHFSLAASSLVAYVAALGGHVVAGDDAYLDHPPPKRAARKGRAAPPRALKEVGPKADPTSPPKKPREREPGLFGGRN